MKRTIIQSLLFSGVLIILYYGVQIGLGYFRSLTYVPGIVESYQSVNYLQQEAAFGHYVKPFGVGLEILGLLIIGIILFISGKFVMKKMMSQRKGSNP